MLASARLSTVISSLALRLSVFPSQEVHVIAAAVMTSIYAFGTDAAPLVAEVKKRKGGAGFTQLERWLGEYDLLVLRRNHADPMIVLPWRTWAALLTRGRR
jgi:hypothetical protein